MTAKAWIYTRVSKAEQASSGMGLERQKQNVERWLKEKDAESWTIGGVFEDRGRSAYKGEHLKHGFGEVLQAIADGIIKTGDIVVAEAVDRFSRAGITTGEEVINSILNAGVWVGCIRQNLCINPSLDSRNTDLNNKLTLIMALKLAHEESEQKSKRIARTFEVKREKGQKFSGNYPKWLDLDRETNEFSFNAHAETIKKMVELRETQQLGAQKLADWAKGEDLPCPTGKPWNKRIVEKYLFEMPQICGEYHQTKRNEETGRKEVVAVHEGYYPELISKDRWVALRSSRKRNTVKGKQAFKNLFTPMLICPRCGGTLQFAKSERGQAKLRCKNRVFHKSCDFDAINYAPIESLLKKTFYNAKYSSTKDSEEDSAALVKAISDKEERIKAITDSLTNIPVELIPQVTAQLKTIQDEVLQLKHQLSEMRNIPSEVIVPKSELVTTEERAEYNAYLNRIVAGIVPMTKGCLVGFKAGEILFCQDNRVIKAGVLKNIVTGNVKSELFKLFPSEATDFKSWWADTTKQMRENGFDQEFFEDALVSIMYSAKENRV
ncbi:MAG: recombinase family protein [Pseudomonadota bacterium]|nr:recombinase family protein [Pseudomonadota bacterium]